MLVKVTEGRKPCFGLETNELGVKPLLLSSL